MDGSRSCCSLDTLQHLSPASGLARMSERGTCPCLFFFARKGRSSTPAPRALNTTAARAPLRHQRPSTLPSTRPRTCAPRTARARSRARRRGSGLARRGGARRSVRVGRRRRRGGRGCLMRRRRTRGRERESLLECPRGMGGGCRARDRPRRVREGSSPPPVQLSRCSHQLVS